jgi:hypothetical protein
MNRRKFIAGLSKFTLLGAATTATTAVAVRENAQTEEPTQGFSRKLADLRKRVDELEEDQKFFLKTLCVVTALSTGIDLSVLL